MKQLEAISEEIHKRRKGLKTSATADPEEPPRGPREPGVGAEYFAPDQQKSSLPDFQFELDRCEVRSVGSLASSSVSERDETEVQDELDVDELKMKVKELALRPVEGGEGRSSDEVWESELKASVNKLDHMMLMQECNKELSKKYVRGEDGLGVVFVGGGIGEDSGAGDGT